MRKLLLLASAIVLVDTMFYAALTPLLPHYADDLGLSKTGAGVLTGSYAAGTLVGGIPSGLLASRLGVKPTVLIGLLVMAATSIAFGVGHNVYVLDTARFFQGVAGACSWTASMAWLVAAAPRERRGELIGFTVSAAVGGALLGPVLGGIASVVGTGPGFGAVAVLGAALAVWAWATPAFPPGERQPLTAFFAALRDVRVAAGLWFIALPALLYGMLSVLAPLKLHRLGVGALAIGIVFLVAAAVESSVSPLMGRLSDRRGRLLPLRIGLMTSTAAALTLPWVDERWAFSAVIVASGIAYGLFWAPSMALVGDGSDALGLDQSFGFALLNLAWAPGQMAGSAVGGAVADATSDAVPFVAAAVVCLLTLALVSGRTAVARWRFASSS